MEDKLSSIYNYLKLPEDIATAGQPREEELKLISKAGYEVVINIDVSNGGRSLADEKGLLHRLGMLYEHLPVVWKNPTSEDLDKFFDLMEKHRHKRRFVHCAANMRVSVFMALYHILKEAWSYDDAMGYVHRIWEPNEIWSKFLAEELSDRNDR